MSNLLELRRLTCINNIAIHLVRNIASWNQTRKSTRILVEVHNRTQTVTLI